MSIVIHHPLFQVKGFFGAPNPIGKAHNYSARHADASASRIKGGKSAVRWYGDRSDKDEPGVLGPTFTLPVVAAQNQKTGWTAQSGVTSNDWEQMTVSQWGGTPVLQCTNGTPAAAPRRWQWGTAVEDNRAWFWRAALTDAVLPHKAQIAAAQWGGLDGNGKGLRWRVELIDGDAKLHLLHTTWTQGNQDALDALRIKGSDMTTGEQSEADALLASLFYETHDLGSVDEKNSYRAAEFIFLPEPQGRLWVLRGSEIEGVEVAAILNTYQRGKVWLSSRPIVSLSSGQMAWQAGEPRFATTSRLKLPSALQTDSVVTGDWDESLPGANVLFERGQDVTEDENEQPIFVNPYEPRPETPPDTPRITLQSNGDHPAWLYNVRGWTHGGERQGPDVSETVVFDSADFASCIQDAVFRCEREHHRLCVNLTLLNPKGRLTLPGFNQPLLHDRLCDLFLSGEKMLGNGLILRAFGNNYASADANQASVLVTRPDSEINLEIQDLWRILDEWVIRPGEDAVLDGMLFGEAIRLCLRLPGFKWSEMSGVSALTGPRIERSPLGRKPAEQLPVGGRLGDYVRRLFVKYAPHLSLLCLTGAWVLAARDLSIKAHFTNAPLQIGEDETIPRYPIFEELDIIRDFSETMNDFLDEGAEGGGGVPLSYSWRVEESIREPNWPGHCGRLKRADTVRDEGNRTPAAVLSGVRSRVRQEGRPGRLANLKSLFVPKLYPGHRVLVNASYEDGTLMSRLHEVETINGGNIIYGQDRLPVLVREVIPVA